VSIAGDQLRSITASEAISFTADAFVSKCDGTGKMHIYIYIYMYVCMYVCIYSLFIYICTYIFMYVYGYIRVEM
jgi:hypothetical protein